MLAFIDESGDAGLKLEQGSSRYFVVAVIFNKTRPDIRRAFLAAVAPYDFFYYGIVINKAGLYGPGFRHKESFYKYVTQLLLLNAREHLEDALINIDASGEREFRRQFTGYLKARINAGRRHIRQVRFLDSAKSSLIQLADMVAGALHRQHGGKADADDYAALVRHRQAGVQIWPDMKKPKS